MRTKPVTDFVFALTPLIVWSLHFFAVYIAEALICTASRPLQSNMHAATIILTLLALAALTLILFSQRKWIGRIRTNTLFIETDFLPLVTVALSLISAIAILWVAIPSFFLPVCEFSPG